MKVSPCNIEVGVAEEVGRDQLHTALMPAKCFSVHLLECMDFSL